MLSPLQEFGLTKLQPGYYAGIVTQQAGKGFKAALDKI